MLADSNGNPTKQVTVSKDKQTDQTTIIDIVNIES